MAPNGTTRQKAKDKKKRLKKLTEKAPCRWCKGLKTCEEGLARIDWKNVDQLQRFVTPQGKIFSRKRSGNCSHSQSLVKAAVKYARQMALMPYVG